MSSKSKGSGTLTGKTRGKNWLVWAIVALVVAGAFLLWMQPKPDTGQAGGPLVEQDLQQPAGRESKIPTH